MRSRYVLLFPSKNGRCNSIVPYNLLTLVQSRSRDCYEIPLAPLLDTSPKLRGQSELIWILFASRETFLPALNWAKEHSMPLTLHCGEVSSQLTELMFLHIEVHSDAIQRCTTALISLVDGRLNGFGNDVLASTLTFFEREGVVVLCPGAVIRSLDRSYLYV
jgi:hypothetical protein